MQSSFIPKKPVGAAPHRASSLNILLLLGILIFLASVALAGGSFFYQKNLQQTIDSNNQKLDKFVKDFGSGAEEFVRLDQKIRTAQTVLENHLAGSLAFRILENITAKNVRFSHFSYSIKGDDKIAFNLKGEARTQNSLAFQSDLFSGGVIGVDPVVKNPIFSDIKVDEKLGVVFFTVDGTLDKSDILYKNNFTAQ